MANILKAGSRGDDVELLQQILNAIVKPIPRLVEDGKFGQKTKDALKVFQSQRGLSADGVAGKNTNTALKLNQSGLPKVSDPEVMKNIQVSTSVSACKAGPPITSAPLWHMLLVAKSGSESSFKLLQDTVDFLTCKARAGEIFNADEKEFLKELYESFWWGGMYKGYVEASALADHYVNGKGIILKINSVVYTSSVIVKDTQTAMKMYIGEKIKNNAGLGVWSTDAELLKRSYYQKLLKGHGRNPNTHGYLVDNGVLMAEQKNSRLKNADHRFVLKSSSYLSATDTVSTDWRVESKYDFESFAKATYFTSLPLRSGMDLRLPDGLSHYMTKIGVANEFDYYASWTETWTK